MRFSTTNITTHHPNTPSMTTIKKVLSNLVSKLPHHHNNKVETVKNDAHTVIKVRRVTALKTEEDINQDIRNYYKQQTTSKKRQLEEAEEKKVKSERERRHKTVKQYQQTQEQPHPPHHHWIEHSNPTIHNKSAQQPKWVNTHGYIRDTRTNSNYLRVLALSNQSNNNIVLNKEKPTTRKRSDEFIWGKQSSLRHVVTL